MFDCKKCVESSHRVHNKIFIEISSLTCCSSPRRPPPQSASLPLFPLSCKLPYCRIYIRLRDEKLCVTAFFNVDRSTINDTNNLLCLFRARSLLVCLRMLLAKTEHATFFSQLYYLFVNQSIVRTQHREDEKV